jgi:hypothetical protein
MPRGAAPDAAWGGFKRDGRWLLLHLHASLAVPNEAITGQ